MPLQLRKVYVYCCNYLIATSINDFYCSIATIGRIQTHHVPYGDNSCPSPHPFHPLTSSIQLQLPQTFNQLLSTIYTNTSKHFPWGELIVFWVTNTTMLPKMPKSFP